MRFLRGCGTYVEDLAFPGLLHAAILRSTFAHAQLRSLDVSRAQKIEGVHAIVTARDVGTSIPLIPLRQERRPELARFEQPVIAADILRYVGEPIAVVLATSRAIAEDSLALIELDAEEMPASLGVPSAYVSGEAFTPQPEAIAMTLRGVLGDANAAFANARYTRRERFKVQRHTAMPMETRGLLATVEADTGRLRVFGAAKVPFAVRQVLARQLGISADAISMVENDVGGGFGVRGEFYPEDFLVPFCARLTGRPVRWIEDRLEHFQATNHAREMDCEIEIACTREGELLALRGTAYCDLGAYLRTNAVTQPRNVAQVISGPYRVPNIEFESVLLMTNKTPAGTYRGPGRFEADFFRERLFDLAASDLGIDRLDFRRRNLVRADEMPYRLPTVLPYEAWTECDSGDYSVTFERCLGEIGWQEKSALQGQLVNGRYRGLGIGCYIESGASGPSENVRLVLETDGSVTLYTGSCAIGQGLETTMAQIAADALEIPIELVNPVLHGSTDYLELGFGTYGSRTIVMGGSAIMDAARKLRDAIRQRAAEKLGCSIGEIMLRGETVETSSGMHATWRELVDRPISADGSYASDKRTYSYGAHAAHVAVDAGTGAIEVLEYVAVEDIGRIINPATLKGQTIGAIVQGLGGALLEHLRYDASGQSLTGSYADYFVPTASDFPRIHTQSLQIHPSPNNPLGAKGGGEGGMIPVAGVIANAVAAALASFDANPLELPLSPERVWTMTTARPTT
jgi:carbon-monoxide dehydrogenase large subunit